MLSSTALTLCTLLSCSALLQCTVFLDQPSAGQILRSSSRRRRANSLLLEEILPGDLERECYEESCSQEEAAEIFQTKEKTVRRRSKLWVRVPEENTVVQLEDQDRGQDSVVVTQVIHVEVKCCRSNFEFLAPQLEFWFKYTNLNPCRTNPCLNGGMCMMERGHFLCLCPPQYHGDTCGSVVLECRYRNGGCMQYCRDLPGGAGVQCGCADGFKLEPDGQRCSQIVSFPCGRQQLELLSHRRSLWNHSELLNISTDSWETGLNFTETGDELMTVNATTENTVTNETELRGEEGGEEDGVTTRIVGGDLEKRGGSPWQVLVHRPDGFGFCGGTLVSDRWVITAAHCMESTADHVTIGDFDKRRPDPGEQLMKVQKIFVHPHFHSFTYDSDIALLYLDRPVIRGPTATPACLPDHHLSKYLLQEGNRGVVTGWGLTRFLGRSSRFLRKVTLPVVSYTDCIASTEQVITDNMYCAGYLDVSRDACSGDSGGPMVVNYRGTWFLTGVVSWGEKCAAKGKYGVYTRLGNFLNWIRDTMERGDVNGTSSSDRKDYSSS